MAHGTPDWGVTAGAVTTFQLTDLAEHAVRVGSVDSFDRRGDVLFIDGFEDGLNKWIDDFVGTGAAVAQSNAQARNELYVARLTAGSDGNRYAEIQHRQALPSLSPLGVEFSFHRSATIDNLELRFHVFDGTNRVRFQVRWRDADEDLQYYDSAGVYQTFATGVTLLGALTLFHTAKLVVDPSAQEYSRFILGRRAYSLANIAGRVDGAAGGDYSQTFIRNTGRAGVNDIVDVDDVILTQNEPV